MKIEIKQHGKPTVRFQLDNNARGTILTLFEYLETKVTEVVQRRMNLDD